MSRRNGFTLVELTLAMAFLSFLLLSIVLLIMQIVTIYTKGTTLRNVSLASQTLSDELKQTLNQTATGTVEWVNQPTGGRLCTGGKSYAWNYGSVINSPGNVANADANKYAAESNTTSKDIRFVKYISKDSNNSICKKNQNTGLYPDLQRNEWRELLSAGDRNVVVHNFKYIETPTGIQTIYAIQMVLGTNNEGESGIINGQLTCKPPSQGYDDFCAVNAFEFTARSNEGVGGDEL